MWPPDLRREAAGSIRAGSFPRSAVARGAAPLAKTNNRAARQGRSAGHRPAARCRRRYRKHRATAPPPAPPAVSAGRPPRRRGPSTSTRVAPAARPSSSVRKWISHRGPPSPIGNRYGVSMGGFDPIEQIHRHPLSMGIESLREETTRWARSHRIHLPDDSDTIESRDYPTSRSHWVSTSPKPRNWQTTRLSPRAFSSGSPMAYVRCNTPRSPQ